LRNYELTSLLLGKRKAMERFHAKLDARGAQNPGRVMQ
jgi:hypothetical protein